jgi:hypothetical protein
MDPRVPSRVEVPPSYYGLAVTERFNSGGACAPRLHEAERAHGAVALRHLVAFLDERTPVDWTLRSNCRRLRIGVNLRRVSVERAIAAMPTPARHVAARDVGVAIDRLDSALRACSTADQPAVEPPAAAAAAGAAVALHDTLVRFLRPIAVVDHDSAE